MDTKYVERAEGRLAYSDYGGSGEPVLMFPGMGDLRSEYRLLAPRLSEAGYRAVTVDLRGHGDSSVPWSAYDVPSVGRDVLTMIEHLDAGEVHLVGTSFAGAAVVWAATERPDQARSLVLVNPFASAAKLSSRVSGLFWLMKHSPRRVCVYAAYYRTLFPTHRPDDFEECVAQLRENMAEQGRMAAAAAMALSPCHVSDERFERVKAPTLVIMGGRDPSFVDPAERGMHIMERTGGKLTLVDEAGHYPQTEMPEETTSIVVDFLNHI